MVTGLKKSKLLHCITPSAASFIEMRSWVEIPVKPITKLPGEQFDKNPCVELRNKEKQLYSQSPIDRKHLGDVVISSCLIQTMHLRAEASKRMNEQ